MQFYDSIWFSIEFSKSSNMISLQFQLVPIPKRCTFPDTFWGVEPNEGTTRRGGVKTPPPSRLSFDPTSATNPFVGQVQFSLRMCVILPSLPYPWPCWRVLALLQSWRNWFCPQRVVFFLVFHYMAAKTAILMENWWFHPTNCDTGRLELWSEPFIENFQPNSML